MYLRTKLLLAANHCFKAPVHPFNLSNAGEKTYAQWQFDQGRRTIEFFLARYSEEEMFRGKTVVDIGCGAAGKSLFYASLGAEKVYGLEILEKYRAEAEALAAEKGLSDRFSYICGDSAAMPFADGFADTVIVNDAMEHVGDPEKTLQEILRILKPGGRAFINFPPYYHPMGAHLTDAIYIPWVHCFFPDKVLIEAYEHLVAPLPDGAERVKFRISRNAQGEEYFSYINKMTIRRYQRILQTLGIQPEYWYEAPLRGFLKPLARFPLTRELFVKMAVCVLRKA